MRFLLVALSLMFFSEVGLATTLQAAESPSASSMISTFHPVQREIARHRRRHRRHHRRHHRRRHHRRY